MQNKIHSHIKSLNKGIVLAQAIITEYHRLDGASSKYLFLIVLKAGQSKIWYLPGFQAVIFSLYPHMAERRERQQKVFSYLFL